MLSYYKRVFANLTDAFMILNTEKGEKKFKAKTKNMMIKEFGCAI